MAKRNQTPQEMAQGAALEIARQFISFLRKNKYDIRQAYIFGSYAKGRFHDDSDIDVAIVMNDISDSFLMQMELMRVSWRFDSRIEPHPFDAMDFNSGNPFAGEILKTGIRVV